MTDTHGGLAHCGLEDPAVAAPWVCVSLQPAAIKPAPPVTTTTHRRVRSRVALFVDGLMRGFDTAERVSRHRPRESLTGSPAAQTGFVSAHIAPFCPDLRGFVTVGAPGSAGCGCYSYRHAREARPAPAVTPLTAHAGVSCAELDWRFERNAVG